MPSLPTRYNILSILARPVGTISSILLIAIVIAVFSYLQAVTDSAFNVMAQTGDPLTVLVINQSADSETVSGIGKDMVNKLQLTPKAVRDEKGVIISAEMVAISSASSARDPAVKVNAAVRGVDFDLANKARDQRVKIIEGRVFAPGTYEVIVGESVASTYLGHKLGDEIEIGNRGIRKFKIVGVFSTGGTAADSEIWGYVETLRDVYSRTGYSSARLRAATPDDVEEMIKYIKGPSVELSAMSEREHFSGMSRNQQATQVFSVVMIIILGIASAFAVANTMYAAVAGRTREIGMLRAIGFSPGSVLVSFMLEGLLLSVMGGIAGCAVSLFANGLRESILPGAFTTVSYQLAITPKIIGVSLAVAITIGFFGSILPAWRAARMPITRSLREA
ncbi:MAG: ABC transporter permease [Phycisphaerales bacterium]|nr:ABC transporter permease [Phycisphaerales bacterium]MCB9854553.1 ABC transporter permease [Phycisphaerales bacterium]MCB9863208.1 ABC transporter permease [Phycisphaerales bacterium]